MSFNTFEINNIKNIERGYIVGIFIGDGYSCYSKKDRHYKVEFYLNSERDKDVINYLCTLLDKININYFSVKDKRCDCLKIGINSKSFKEFIESEIKFLKKNNLSETYALGLLSGFFDAEGYYQVNNSALNIAQKDKETILFFEEIAKSFGINGSLKWSRGYNGGKGVWRLGISVNFKNLPHNSQKASR